MEVFIVVYQRNIIYSNTFESFFLRSVCVSVLGIIESQGWEIVKLADLENI